MDTKNKIKQRSQNKQKYGKKPNTAKPAPKVDLPKASTPQVLPNANPMFWQRPKDKPNPPGTAQVPGEVKVRPGPAVRKEYQEDLSLPSPIRIKDADKFQKKDARQKRIKDHNKPSQGINYDEDYPVLPEPDQTAPGYAKMHPISATFSVLFKKGLVHSSQIPTMRASALLLDALALREATKNITKKADREPQATAMARKNGFFLRDVVPDGNCLFRALCLCVGLNQNQHKIMRIAIVDYIKTHLSLFEPFMQMPPLAYLLAINTEGEWGGYIELRAFADLYSQIVVVHQLQMAPIIFAPDDGVANSTINLVYLYESHYAALIPVNPNERALHIEGKPVLPQINLNDDDVNAQLEDKQEEPIKDQPQKLPAPVKLLDPANPIQAVAQHVPKLADPADPARIIQPAPHKQAVADMHYQLNKKAFNLFAKNCAYKPTVNPQDETVLKKFATAGLHVYTHKLATSMIIIPPDLIVGTVRLMYSGFLFAQCAKRHLANVRIHTYCKEPWEYYKAARKTLGTPFNVVAYAHFAPRCPSALIFPINQIPNVEIYFLYNNNDVQPQRFSQERILAQLTLKRSVWAFAMAFPDAAGTICNELAYLRTADVHTVEIAQVKTMGDHVRIEAADWLWNTNSFTFNGNTMYWTMFNDWNNFALFEFRLGVNPDVVISRERKVNIVQSSSFPIPPPVVSTVLAGLQLTQHAVASYIPSNFSKWLPYWLKPHLHLVHFKILNELKMLVANRPKTSLVLKQLQAKCNELLNSDNDLKLACETFPSQTHSMIMNTASTVFYQQPLLDYHNRASLSQDLDAIMETDNLLVANVGVAPKIRKQQPFWQNVLLGVASAATVWAILRYAPKLPYSKLVPTIVQKTINMFPKSVGAFLPDSVVDALQPAAEQSSVVLEQTPFSIPWLFYGVCVAPFLEEGLKRIHPMVAHFFIAYEFASYTNQGVPMQWRIPSLFMHYYVLNLPYKRAVLYHSLFNVVCFAPMTLMYLLAQLKHNVKASLPIKNKIFCLPDILQHGGALCATLPFFPMGSRLLPSIYLNGYYNTWRHNFYFSAKDTRYYTPAYTSAIVPIDNPFLPAQEAWVAEIPERNIDLKVKNTIVPTVSSQMDSIGTWAMVITDVPFYRPDRSMTTILYTAHCRLLAEPPLDCMTQAHAWLHRPSFVTEQFPTIDWQESLPAWLAHLKEEPAKYHKYLPYVEEFKLHGMALIEDKPITTKVEVKKNEVLFRPSNNHLEFKPRPIANLKPIVQVAIGPIIYEASRRLKNHWNLLSEPFQHGQYKYKIVMGGALSDYDLSVWMTQASIPSINLVHILVSGDDTLVIVWDELGNVHIFEGDFKMFDQSQSFGPLRFQGRTLAKLGAPQEVLSILMKVDLGPLKLTTKDPTMSMTINRQENPSLSTGGPNTSTGNSTSASGSWVIAISEVGLDTDALTDFFEDTLGLKLKLQVHHNFAQATFLKGMWAPCVANASVKSPLTYIWMPLMSRCLKLGKALDNPQTLYPKTTKLQATEQFLSDTAKSYAHFAPVPIVRAFVHRYAIFPVRRQFIEKHQIQHSVEMPLFWKQYEFDYSFMLERYGLDEMDVARAEKLYANSYPGSMLIDPCFHALAMKDYA